MTVEWQSLLGRQVRVFNGPDHARTGEPMAEGEVVAVCLVPTITLRAADGSTSHYATSLPIEVMERSEP